jgi:Lrp/AsnC family transcriptional regulator for asnA, asnC and gidA
MMDEIDKLILKRLQEDGRTHFTLIAREAQVSESTIRSRYRTLIDQGVVHTVSIVDPYALDFQAPAILGMSVEPGIAEDVAKVISKLPDVSYVVLTLGTYDLIVEVYCRDIPHLTDFIANQIAKISGVKQIDTLLITKSLKLSYRWSPDLELEDSDQ